MTPAEALTDISIPIFRFRLADAGAEQSVLVLERIDGRELWRHGPLRAAEAANMLEAAIEDAKLAQLWGRLAAIAGTEALADRIAMLATKRSARVAAEEAERIEREENARKVQCWRFNKEPKVELRKGDETFVVITFREAWERDRFIDWAWHQSEPLTEWYSFWTEHGSAALERRLLEAMLRKEGEVKKAGLSAGGRRPLRFWRGDPS